MERFLVVTTTTEQVFADRACAVLEDAGIPVMLEHVEIHEAGRLAMGFRLMVPSQFTQTAMKLVKATSNAYFVGRDYSASGI